MAAGAILKIENRLQTKRKLRKMRKSKFVAVAVLKIENQLQLSNIITCITKFSHQLPDDSLIVRNESKVPYSKIRGGGYRLFVIRKSALTVNGDIIEGVRAYVLYSLTSGYWGNELQTPASSI
jgi:hypothetical protein